MCLRHTSATRARRGSERGNCATRTTRSCLPPLTLSNWTCLLDRPVGQNGATMWQRLGLVGAVLATMEEGSKGRTLIVVTHQPIAWLDEHVEV